MASECYQGTIPLHPQATTLPLPLPTARCIPEGGICYTSLSHGEGQATAQLGCWPSQTTMHLAWLGVPECKNEIGKLICLCLDSVCNGFLPSPNGESSPVFGDLQGLTMTFLVLLLLVMLVVVLWSLGKNIKRHTRKARVDEEQGLDNSSTYLQRQISPCYNDPPTPPNQSSSPTPLLRMSSAPASLPSPNQSNDCQLAPYTKSVIHLNNNSSCVQMVDRPIIDMGGPIAKYLDISRIKTFTRPVAGVVKRLDLGEGSVQNWAFAKEDDGKVPTMVMKVGKVTAV